MLNPKWTIPVVIAAGLALAGQPSADLSAKAQAKSVAQPQSQRVVDTQPARDAETYSDDIRLTNQCIDRGGRKAECLCVVQVLKYEMSVGDYRRAASSWSVPARYADRPTRAPAPAAIRSLIAAPDFGSRCAEARRYFESERP